MPRWVYKRIRQIAQGDNPVIVRDGQAFLDQEQIAEHLLCSPCDQRLGDAEDYLSRVSYLSDGTCSALQRPTLHAVETPFGPMEGLSASDLQTETIAFAAAGILWKAAVCRHPRTGKPRLGPYAERFRRYLVGEMSFPVCARVVVAILAMEVAAPFFGVMSFPVTNRDPKVVGAFRHEFMVAGVYFQFIVGKTVGGRADIPCIVHKPREFRVLLKAPWQTIGFVRSAIEPMIRGSEPSDKLRQRLGG